jgi:hypothetical protein|tara:strand:+ start:41 stop:736 length:696 start_codon:yes stop_codon:yes gene_type:complete
MAISVDNVYTKVLSILNKESRGFLTPGEFNKIASQVQLDLLDKAFYDYNRAIVRQSAGRGGQGYADIPRKIQDKIDPFYATSSISLTSGVGTLPTFYNIINVSADSRLTDVERIEKSKLSFLLSSPLTAPSTTFPIYYITGSTITVNPSSLSTIQMDYVSVPADPVWANTVDSTTGALTFDSANAVDFTLHPSEEVELVLGVLKYAGVVIKDPSVIQMATQEDNIKTQLEN